jgi:hypothetical protein
MIRKVKHNILTDLPPIHGPQKELLGVLGMRPVLPLYAELSPTGCKKDISVDEIEELLEACFEDCGPEYTWSL